MGEVVSFGCQLARMAADRRGQSAIVHVGSNGQERDVTWLELDRRSNQVARLLQRRGVGQGAIVVVALRNSPEHFFTDFAAWRLGATVLPLRWDLPSWERDRLLQLTRPAAVVAAWDDAPPGTLSPKDLDETEVLDGGTLPDRIADPVRMIASSGSSGRPKLIVTPLPGVVGADAMSQSANVLQSRGRTTELVVSPLYHTNGFSCFNGLLEGQRLVVMERFDARLAIDLIERHHVNSAIMVPTMLKRIAEVPDVRSRDFSSVDAVMYGGAPIAHWVVRAWLDMVGPEHFVLSYGGTEAVGLTLARGNEWLGHVGTVGRPVDCDLKIVDDNGRALPPGSVGAVYLRRHGVPVARYVGTEDLAVDDEGFATFGDLGWLDDDGYLYIADRRSDMIVTGGANVYPAEVETVLAEHRGVADVVVVGIPDADWGHRVHAIVEPADHTMPPDHDELRAHVRARLAAYKVPKSVEIVEHIGRTDAGKVNRTSMAAARSQRSSAEPKTLRCQ
jgi:bile acid-coenzyme A ligase